MINLDEIRQEVAIKHNVLLGKDDPILVTVTINEAVLSRYLDLASQNYSAASQELTIALQQQQEQAKAVAGQIITSAANYVSEQVKESVKSAVDATIKEAGEHIKKEIAQAQAARLEVVNSSETAQTAKNGAVMAAVIAGAAAVISLATLVIVILK